MKKSGKALAIYSDALLADMRGKEGFLHTGAFYDAAKQVVVPYVHYLIGIDRKKAAAFKKRNPSIDVTAIETPRILVSTDGRVTNAGKHHLKNKGPIKVTFPDGRECEYKDPANPLPVDCGYKNSFQFGLS
jgi:hypothetical protein